VRVVFKQPESSADSGSEFQRSEWNIMVLNQNSGVFPERRDSRRFMTGDPDALVDIPFLTKLFIN